MLTASGVQANEVRPEGSLSPPMMWGPGLSLEYFLILIGMMETTIVY